MLDHNVVVVGHEGDFGGGCGDELLTGFCDLGRRDPLGADDGCEAEEGEGSEGDGLLAHGVFLRVDLGNIALVL